MMQILQSQQTEWWHDFFDDLFADVVLQRNDPEECKKTKTFLNNVLSLKEDDLIFDQCCGAGDISLLLNKQGYNTIGIDIIPSYIKKAQTSASQLGLKSSQFDVADARTYVPQTPCDAAINWYTSFGYSADDKDNIRMLDCLYKSLKPDAKVVMDITNMATSIRNGETISHYTQQTDDGVVEIERQFFFDLENGMRGSIWRYHMPDGTHHEKAGSSRLYAPRELKTMFLQTGFDNIHFYGDLDGGTLKLDSPRCFIVGQKKGL